VFGSLTNAKGLWSKQQDTGLSEVLSKQQDIAQNSARLCVLCVSSVKNLSATCCGQLQIFKNKLAFVVHCQFWIDKYEFWCAVRTLLSTFSPFSKGGWGDLKICRVWLPSKPKLTKHYTTIPNAAFKRVSKVGMFQISSKISLHFLG
jgi:hypothetical protein